MENRGNSCAGLAGLCLYKMAGGNPLVVPEPQPREALQPSLQGWQKKEKFSSSGIFWNPCNVFLEGFGQTLANPLALFLQCLKQWRIEMNKGNSCAGLCLYKMAGGNALVVPEHQPRESLQPPLQGWQKKEKFSSSGIFWNPCNVFLEGFGQTLANPLALFLQGPKQWRIEETAVQAPMSL